MKRKYHKQQAQKGGLIKEIFQLYTPVEFILLLAFYVGIGYYYFHLLLRDVLLSSIFTAFSTMFFFWVFSYQDRKLKQYQEDLIQLSKYVNSIIFFMQTGSNVMNALKQAEVTLSKRIQKEVNKTITKMEEEQVLDTNHFEKYKFDALNQFHQHLALRYEKGGDTKELFGTIQNRMVLELQKRDELYRKKKGLRMNILVLLALALATTVMLAIMTPELWTVFLTYKKASLAIIAIHLALCLGLLYKVQQKAIDISVRL